MTNGKPIHAAKFLTDIDFPATKADLINQFLYLDATASSSRQAISAFGPVHSAAYSSANNTQVSTWSISPYLRHRFGSSADLTVRYTRDSVSQGATGLGTSLGSTRPASTRPVAATRRAPNGPRRPWPGWCPT